MDFYILLGVERAASAGRHQARLQAARPQVSPGHQPGRSAGGGAVPPDRGSLRNADRSGSPPPLRLDRLGGRAGRAGAVRLRRVRLLRQRQRIGGLDLRRSVRRRAATSATRGVDERASERGADLHQTITIAFEEAIRGGAAPAHRHAAGALPRRAAARAGSRSPRRGACRATASATVKIGARPHGVFADLRALRRNGATAPHRAVRPAAGSRSKCAPSR